MRSTSLRSKSELTRRRLCYSFTSLQADLKAAELAKRGLEAERKELAQLRDALRQQQTQAATEAARLADLQKVGGSYQLAGWAVDASSGSGCCRWAGQRLGCWWAVYWVGLLMNRRVAGCAIEGGR